MFLGDGEVGEKTKKSAWVQWDTKWCLAAAKWALFAFLTRGLRTYHEWSWLADLVIKAKSPEMVRVEGPPKQPEAN